MTDWGARLAQDVADQPAKVRVASSFYNANAAALRRYHGGMPLGFLCGIAEHESGGKMSSIGDPSLGEVGFFQITENFPRTIDVDPEVRRTAVGNIFLACVEYAIEAKRLSSVKYPGVVLDGTMDQWLLARAVFALGAGAVRTLLTLVGPVQPGRVYETCLAWSNANPTATVGPYTGGKAQYRLKSAVLQWQVGLEVAMFTMGVPVRPPSPPGITYRVPSDVRLPTTAEVLVAQVALPTALLLI